MTPDTDTVCPHWSTAEPSLDNLQVHFARESLGTGPFANIARASLREVESLLAVREAIGLLKQAGEPKPWRVPGI